MARLSPERQEWVRKEYESFNGDAETTARAIRAAGGEASAFFADITDFDAAGRLVQYAVDTYGGIDIVVNVAGAFGFCAIEEMDQALWDKVLAVKPTGYFYVIRHAVPYMIEKGWGRIINCSSGAFMGGTIRQCEYCAANAGVLGLTRSVARELAPKGITCNAVAPGLIRTDMTAALTDNGGALEASIPLGRAGTPEDVAQAVAFLASASYITGEVLRVDGGLAI